MCLPFGFIYMSWHFVIPNLCRLTPCVLIPSAVFGLLENGMLAANMITLVEAERRDLTVGYLKGAPGFYGFMILASIGEGNASKLPFLLL